MEELFREVSHSTGEHSVMQIAGNLAIAATFGVVIATVYYFTQRRSRKQVASFVATLVLLTVLLAMVTLVIGNSVARAFGLVGALSIVRFRTVVDDTRDTAFVIFAVVTGMAVGSGLVVGAIAALPVVSLTAIALSLWSGRSSAESLSAAVEVKVAAAIADPEALVANALSKHAQEFSLTAVGTAKQGAAIELKYQVTLRPSFTPVALILELHRTEGVQSVEWKTD
jgi:predicted outer membrane lipoprotein